MKVDPHAVTACHARLPLVARTCPLSGSILFEALVSMVLLVIFSLGFLAR